MSFLGWPAVRVVCWESITYMAAAKNEKKNGEKKMENHGLNNVKKEKSYKNFYDRMVNFFIHLNQKLSTLSGCNN